MRALLFLILVSFSTVSLAEVKIIRGTGDKPETPVYRDVIATPKPEVKPAEPKKEENQEKLLIIPAIRHCINLERGITEPYRFIAAFNNATNPDLAASMADYGFIIPRLWTTAQRPQRTQFNALVSLKLYNQLGFKQEGFKFHGNCTVKEVSEITKANGFSRANVTLPLVVDINEKTLTYHMVKQDGYNWVIESLGVNSNKFSNSIALDIQGLWLDQAIKKLCNKDLGLNCPE